MFEARQLLSPNPLNSHHIVQVKCFYFHYETLAKFFFIDFTKHLRIKIIQDFLKMKTFLKTFPEDAFPLFTFKQYTEQLVS